MAPPPAAAPSAAAVAALPPFPDEPPDPFAAFAPGMALPAVALPPPAAQPTTQAPPPSIASATKPEEEPPVPRALMSSPSAITALKGYLAEPEKPAAPEPEGPPAEIRPDEKAPQVTIVPPPPRPKHVFKLPTPRRQWKLKLPSRKVLAAVGGGLAVVGLAAALLHPVPRVVTVPCQLVPTVLGQPRTPRAGTVATMAVKDGAEVKEGETLATLDPEALQGREVKLVGELEALRAAEERLQRPRKIPEEPAAAARLSKAQKALDAIVAQKAKAKPAQLAALERTEQTRRAAVEAAAARLEALTHDVERAKAVAARTAAEEELSTVKRLLAVSEITSPATGTFIAPPRSARAGGSVDAGEPWGRIVAHDIPVRVTAGIPPSAQLDRASLTVAGSPMPLELRPLPDGGLAGVTSGSVAYPITGTIELPAGTRAWILRDPQPAAAR